MCREACYAVIGLQTRMRYDLCPWGRPYHLRRETAAETGGFAMSKRQRQRQRQGAVRVPGLLVEGCGWLS